MRTEAAMPPKRRAKRKAAAPAAPAIRPTTCRTAHVAVPAANDAPNPRADAQVATAEVCAQVSNGEEEVEALRQQATEVNRKAEELQAQLQAAQADSSRMRHFCEKLPTYARVNQ